MPSRDWANAAVNVLYRDETYQNLHAAHLQFCSPTRFILYKKQLKQPQGFGGRTITGSLTKTMLHDVDGGWSIEPRPLLRPPTLHRTLPSAWLDITSSASRPLVHSNEVSSWLPELRTLALGGNDITMPVYDALQSVIGFSSLQVLDLSGNALSGDMEHSFDLHYCEGGSLGSCESTATKTGASDMAIVLLASNRIEGGVGAILLPRSMSVLTVSDNLLHGPVPDDFSQLSVLMAGEKRREIPGGRVRAGGRETRTTSIR